jgi:hypothetical protein
MLGERRSGGAIAARPQIGGVGGSPAPRLPGTVHTRRSNGRENDAKGVQRQPKLGNVVHLMSNTTSVSVGGIARGMIRVGSPVTKVDAFTY